MSKGYELEGEGTRDQIELAKRYSRVAGVFAETDPRTIGEGAAAAAIMGRKLMEPLGCGTPLGALLEARKVSQAFAVLLKGGTLKRTDGGPIDAVLGDVVCLHLLLAAFSTVLAKAQEPAVIGGRLAELN